jgi:hypothetical protein
MTRFHALLDTGEWWTESGWGKEREKTLPSVSPIE